MSLYAGGNSFDKTDGFMSVETWGSTLATTTSCIWTSAFSCVAGVFFLQQKQIVVIQPKAISKPMITAQRTAVTHIQNKISV